MHYLGGQLIKPSNSALMSNRRTFLKTGSLALAAAAIFPRQVFADSAYKDILGLQLYSVRDDMKTDPLGTLKQVAAMGYRYVEHANYVDRKFYGYSAKEFKKILADLGLIMPSGHTVMGPDAWDNAKNDFADSWKYTVEDAHTLGLHFVISPWLDESLRKDYDGLLKWMDIFNKSGELCKSYGMKFGYHNHDFEFNTTIHHMRLYDIIMQRTDPHLVAQQLDMGNMYGAGGRPLEIVRQYPGRFELMHVKDEIKGSHGMDGYESTILGTGVIHTKEVIDLGRRIGGTKYFIIEQESYQGMAPLAAAKKDYEIMKRWGY